MSAHDEACSGSRSLCDQLYAKLKAQIPELQRGPTQRWCGYYVPGRKRFAYVAHFKTSSRVEVWCLGDLKSLEQARPPQVRPRNRTDSGGWEDSFPGRFEAQSAGDVAAGARLLYSVSFPRS